MHPGLRHMCINGYTLNCYVENLLGFVLPQLTADLLWFLLQRKVKKALGSEQVKRMP